MNEIDAIKQILKTEKLRITQSRLVVAEFLIKNQGKFFTSEEIYQEIQNSKQYDCDQVSIYRTLTAFEKLAIVSKTSFKGEAARYKFNEDLMTTSRSHEHFFKCTICSIIEPFEGCFVSKKEKELEKKGYKKLSHHLEIIGVCPKCAA